MNTLDRSTHPDIHVLRGGSIPSTGFLQSISSDANRALFSFTLGISADDARPLCEVTYQA